LNIYDTKLINCYKCGKWVGEVAYDAEIICPKCGDCADPFPKSDDLLPIPVKRSFEKKLLGKIQSYVY